jgi:translocation and assembly module TamA
MKARAASARMLSMLILVSLLAGCASLPFFGKDADADGRAPAEPQVPLYELEVRAPGTLRQLLLDYLDLARFQSAPASEAITPAELDRLAAAAPAQARSLLETEGYFDAEVKVTRSDGAAGLPRLEVEVVPGPRVIVRSVAIDSTTPFEARAPTREEPWRDRLEKLRAIWSLREGEPFRQPAWNSAKNAALGALRGDGYPRAEWQSTKARIDAVEQTAALSVTVEPGPLFHVGPIRIEGTHRYDEEAIRRVVRLPPGSEYSEKRLLDIQERILKLGLFEGASVEVDANGPAEAAPVVVKVKELSQHQATVGVGISANTGPRISLEHWDRKVFGQNWTAHTTLTLGPDLKSLGTEFTAYPDENLWRKLAAANIEQLRSADETRNSWSVRSGRSKDTNDFERLYYLEASYARVQSAPLTTSSNAVFFNYQWLRRDLDNILLPTTGTALGLQGGVGYGDGTRERSDMPGTSSARAPFVRVFGRFNYYQRVGSWFANTRVDAGQVFVSDPIAVPDPILFRAGGDNSVRGYDYRTLGPTVNGAVVGGRVLLTGSVEFEHPLLDRLPALLGALFVDAGDAADRWTDLRPVFGYGAGVHYRSPVGPLRLDLAYGQAVRQLRLHVSVGVAF